MDDVQLAFENVGRRIGRVDVGDQGFFHLDLAAAIVGSPISVGFVVAQDGNIARHTMGKGIWKW